MGGYYYDGMGASVSGPVGAGGGGAALTYVQQVTADSPTAWWKLDEASGNVADSSGNSQTLAPQGSAPTYHVAGPGTGAGTTFGCSFVAASSQAFTKGSAAPLFLADVMTIEVWYKRSATQGATQGFIDKGASYGFGMASDNTIQFSGGGQVLATSSGTLTDTASWHHIVVTKNGSTRKVYLDGVDVTSLGTNATLADGGSDLFLGWRGGYQTGSLSNVAMYTTALSAARVSAHFAAMV